MRKLFFLSLLFIGITSCEDVVEPRPVIQGEVDAVLFRSKEQFASKSNNQINIQGLDFDQLNLTINGITPGLYTISSSSVNSASFIKEGNTYTTAAPDASGMIEIEEITETYVTGNFYFEARRNGIGNRLNFSKGVFYQIPILGANLPGDGD